MNYRPKYYVLQELVPPEVFAERGEHAWELLDVALLVTLDQVRSQFGKIVINNWHHGGALRESGLCGSGSSAHAKFSQHKYGRAADIHPQSVTPLEVWEFIRAHRGMFPQLTVMENIEFTKGWVHLDTRNIDTSQGIVIVNPIVK